MPIITYEALEDYRKFRLSSRPVPVPAEPRSVEPARRPLIQPGETSNHVESCNNSILARLSATSWALTTRLTGKPKCGEIKAGIGVLGAWHLFSPQEPEATSENSSRDGDSTEAAACRRPARRSGSTPAKRFRTDPSRVRSLAPVSFRGAALVVANGTSTPAGALGCASRTRDLHRRCRLRHSPLRQPPLRARPRLSAGQERNALWPAKNHWNVASAKKTKNVVVVTTNKGCIGYARRSLPPPSSFRRFMVLRERRAAGLNNS